MKRWITFLLVAFSIILIGSTSMTPGTVVKRADNTLIDSRAYSDVDSAVAAIGATVATLVISQPEVPTAAIVFPATLAVHFVGPGSLTSTNGSVAFQSNDIRGPNQTLFIEGASDFDFAAGTILRSSWFVDLEEAFDLTLDDNIRLIITTSSSLDTSASVGTNVVLDFPSSSISVSADNGVNLDNISDIEADNHQIFTGAGDFDFIAGTSLKSSWFGSFTNAVTYIGPDTVQLEIDEDVSQSGNIVIPATLTLKLTNGYIDLNTNDLTINSKFTHGLSRAFDVTGGSVLLFGAGTVSAIEAIWMGTLDDVSLNVAIAAANGEEVTINLYAGTWDITDNVVLPQTASMSIPRGAILDIDTGKSVTFNGTLDAGYYRIKIGDGTLEFAVTAVPAIRTCWFANNISPRVTAGLEDGLQEAIDACSDSTDSDDEWIPLEVESMYLLASSLEIDKLVDTQPDSYFRIFSNHQGGFYVNTAIEMFTVSASMGFTAAPVSQLIEFDGIHFESGTPAHAAYVLDDGKFLRMQFSACDFNSIKLVNVTTAAAYLQSYRIINCQARRFTGTWLSSRDDGVPPDPVGVFDLKIMGSSFECQAGDTVIDIGVVSGASIADNLMEGCDSSAIKYQEAIGLSIDSNYFEANGDSDGYDIDGTSTNAEPSYVSITGNFISHIAQPGYTPANTEAIFWDRSKGVSHGNSVYGICHDLDSNDWVVAYTTMSADIDISGDFCNLGDITGGYPANPDFMVLPAGIQAFNAGATTTIDWGTEIKDNGAQFAANTFTARRSGWYHFDVMVDISAMDLDATAYTISLVTTYRNYTQQLDPQIFAVDPAFHGMSISLDVPMSDADTAYVTVGQTGGATQSSVTVTSFFSGRFIHP